MSHFLHIFRIILERLVLLKSFRLRPFHLQIRRRIRGTLDFRPYGMEENKTKEKKHSLRMHRIGEKQQVSKESKYLAQPFHCVQNDPVVFFVNFCLLLQELQNSVYQKKQHFF